MSEDMLQKEPEVSFEYVISLYFLLFIFEGL